jgi:hypothetical protein
MFIQKDARQIQFRGTIDNDVLEKFRGNEIAWCCNEFAMCELSGTWKRHATGTPLSVNSVTSFGRRKMTWAHIRNFAKRVDVVGEPTTHPAVGEILKGLKPVDAPIPRRVPPVTRTQSVRDAQPIPIVRPNLPDCRYCGANKMDKDPGNRPCDAGGNGRFRIFLERHGCLKYQWTVA